MNLSITVIRQTTNIIMKQGKLYTQAVQTKQKYTIQLQSRDTFHPKSRSSIQTVNSQTCSPENSGLSTLTLSLSDFPSELSDTLILVFCKRQTFSKIV